MGFLDRLDRRNQEIADEQRAHADPPDRGSWLSPVTVADLISGYVADKFFGVWSLVGILAIGLIVSVVRFLLRR
jgi:hypothetical protein